MNNNWYIVLELEFDPPVTNEDIITARIEEKRKLWSLKYNDYKMGKQYQLWLSNVSKIKKDMLGTDNIRSKLAREACELVYTPIDKLISAVENNKQITDEEIDKISVKTGQNKDMVLKRVEFHGITIIKDTESDRKLYEKYYLSEPIGIIKYRSLQELLNVSGYKNLYEFLYSENYDFSCLKYSCQQLQQKSRQKRNEFNSNNAVSSNGQKLCGHCDMIFNDTQNKDIYDEYIIHSYVKSILDNLKTIAEISKIIKQKNIIEAINEIAKFYDFELSKNITMSFLEAEKLNYEKLSETNTTDRKSNQSDTATKEKSKDNGTQEYEYRKNTAYDSYKRKNRLNPFSIIKKFFYWFFQTIGFIIGLIIVAFPYICGIAIILLIIGFFTGHSQVLLSAFWDWLVDLIMPFLKWCSNLFASLFRWVTNIFK
ncbi:MAG: hypothetical protein IJX24_00265 [Oscillospiraceae bacterium]|nr:hypothetical protein [Oscillospiraceae bacterium]